MVGFYRLNLAQLFDNVYGIIDNIIYATRLLQSLPSSKSFTSMHVDILFAIIL